MLVYILSNSMYMCILLYCDDIQCLRLTLVQTQTKLDQWLVAQIIAHTVEPPNKGHFGSGASALYSEVVL